MRDLLFCRFLLEKYLVFFFGTGQLISKKQNRIFQSVIDLISACRYVPKNCNILLTDSPLNTKENKQEIARIMFEVFRVESLAIINTSVLSLFSTGKTSGLVVECGEGVSYSVPVFEGYALPHAILKLDIAG